MTLFELTFDRTPYNAAVTLVMPALAALTFHAAVQLHEPLGNHFVVGLVLAFGGLVRWLTQQWHIGVLEALRVATSMFGVFCATIFASMSVYRVFFHPLRHVPGPLWCKLSMWPWVYVDWVGTRRLTVQAIHKRYGPVVRVGPRVLSVADPRGLLAIYGPTGPAQSCRRGPWYATQSSQPGVNSLQSEPTLPEHNKRRRDWDPAFSLKALQTYEPNIVRNTDTLISQISRLAAKNGGRVDVRECMMWFGFDVMGELGFGRSFGTLEAAKTSYEVHLIEVGVRALNALANVPYFAAVLRYLPSPVQAFEAWLEAAVQWRKGKQGDRQFVAADVMAYLMGEQGATKHNGHPRDIFQDCMLLVVAGSDTTSNTLSFCLFELAQQPKLIQRVRAEVEHIAADDFAGLRDKAPLLNACLNEALRLWPAVPSGLTRETTVPHTLPGNISVPPSSVLSTHTWTMHRDPNNFHDPEKYIPDRWINKSQPFNEKAFSPFGYGATSCIGKNLAFMEMRLVLAHFILALDFSLPKADEDVFRRSIRDQFVMAAEQLNMRISAR